MEYGSGVLWDHAWIETDDGRVYDPRVHAYYQRVHAYYSVEDYVGTARHRYTKLQVVRLMRLTGNSGPWYEEEREKEKQGGDV